MPLQIPLLSSSSHKPADDNNDGDPHVPDSLPPWVHVNDGDEKAPFLSPPPVVPNTRHWKPPPPTGYKPGRKWDHLRTAEPGLLSAPIADEQTRWVPFMQSGPNAREYRGEGRVMDQEWMEQNMPVFSRTWEEEDEKNPEAHKGLSGFKGIMYGGKWLISPERQEKSVRLFWRLLLKNAFVPLVFRITVLAFSAAALGVSGGILHTVDQVNRDSDPYNQCAPRASTYMGIIVSTIAIPYVAYVTWDEYMSKPLGLRSVAAKTLLLLCDLYFIVFSASNLSLAFSALLDGSWACYDDAYQEVGDIAIQIPRTCPNNPTVCAKQRALSGVLIVALIAWLLCFSISVLRVVEKLRLDY